MQQEFIFVCSDEILSRFADFDEAFERFSDWLSQMEVKSKDGLSLTKSGEKDNAEDHLRLYRSYREELTAKQSELDDLTNMTPHLHQTGVTNDGRLAMQLTQIHSRYSALANVLKVFVSNFTLHVLLSLFMKIHGYSAHQLGYSFNPQFHGSTSSCDINYTSKVCTF